MSFHRPLIQRTVTVKVKSLSAATRQVMKDRYSKETPSGGFKVFDPELSKQTASKEEDQD